MATDYSRIQEQRRARQESANQAKRREGIQQDNRNQARQDRLDKEANQGNIRQEREEKRETLTEKEKASQVFEGRYPRPTFRVLLSPAQMRDIIEVCARRYFIVFVVCVVFVIVVFIVILIALILLFSHLYPLPPCRSPDPFFRHWHASITFMFE